MATLEELQQLKGAIERYAIEVKAEPVRLASGGWSHYYCDGKLVTLHPVYARIIGRLMAPAVVASGAEAVGGMAVGCIPIADAVAQAALDLRRVLPTFFGRPEAKDHGPQAKAGMSQAATDDGPLVRPGRKVAIVEDAVTTGGSSIKAVQVAQAERCEVVLMMTMIERHEGGGARFRELGIPFKRLFYTHEDGSLHVDEELLASLQSPAPSR